MIVRSLGNYALRAISLQYCILILHWGSDVLYGGKAICLQYWTRPNIWFLSLGIEACMYNNSIYCLCDVGTSSSFYLYYNTVCYHQLCHVLIFIQVKTKFPFLHHIFPGDPIILWFGWPTGLYSLWNTRKVSLKYDMYCAEQCHFFSLNLGSDNLVCIHGK